MWLAYALLCAFLLSAQSIVQKKTLMQHHAMEFAASLAMFSMVLCIPLLFFIDFSLINPIAIMIIFFVSILGSIAYLFVAKSVRHMEISEASPMLVLGPGITAILAFFFLGEKLNSLQVLGIGVLIFGSYLLELKDYHDIWHPMRVLKTSRYHYFIIAAIVLYSICALCDRYVLSRFDFDPVAYIAIVHIFLAINFLIMITIFHDGWRGIVNGSRNMGVWLLLAAMLTVGYRMAQITAVKTAYLGLVLPIKRMSAFFTVIVGGELFKEHNIRRKSVACAIMVVGVLMIVL